jgi:hypothetical protein
MSFTWGRCVSNCKYKEYAGFTLGGRLFVNFFEGMPDRLSLYRLEGRKFILAEIETKRQSS